MVEDLQKLDGIASLEVFTYVEESPKLRDVEGSLVITYVVRWTRRVLLATKLNPGLERDITFAPAAGRTALTASGEMMKREVW